jgi:hypothetical protein
MVGLVAVVAAVPAVRRGDAIWVANENDNQISQLCVAADMYATDHDDRYPDLVSPNQIKKVLTPYDPHHTYIENVTDDVWNEKLSYIDRSRIKDDRNVWLLHTIKADPDGNYCLGTMESDSISVDAAGLQRWLTQPLELVTKSNQKPSSKVAK